MKILGVIPARFASERFPGKPLVSINGKPMVQWVYEAARKALPRVVVATDDQRILDFVRGMGGDAVLTSAKCQSGTDRVAEVARKITADIYFNIQGDEPLMHADTIKKVLALHRDPHVQMGTAATGLVLADWKNPDVVKVLVDKNQDAIYFSRAPLPFFRDEQSFICRRGARPCAPTGVYKHLGIYSFQAKFLKQFVKWPQAFLEKAEKLEQLRAVQNGIRIRVALTPYDSIGVDRQKDVKLIKKILRNSKL